jgi:hypothetical protein
MSDHEPEYPDDEDFTEVVLENIETHVKAIRGYMGFIVAVILLQIAGAILWIVLGFILSNNGHEKGPGDTGFVVE